MDLILRNARRIGAEDELTDIGIAGGRIAVIEPGHTLLLDDGKVRLVAIGPGGSGVLTRVVVGGKLSDRKGVSLPDTTVPITALTTKDLSDLEAALDAGTDWVALSFVQRPVARRRNRRRHT